MSVPRVISNKFPKSARILKRVDFLRVQGKGRKFHGRYVWLAVSSSPRAARTDDSDKARAGCQSSRVVMLSDRGDISVVGPQSKELGCRAEPGRPEAVAVGEPPSRFGFTISKRTLKSAVKRNLIRRRLREAVRLVRSQMRDGYDIVLVVKQEAEGVGFDDLSRELKFLLNKASLWRRER